MSRCCSAMLRWVTCSPSVSREKGSPNKPMLWVKSLHIVFVVTWFAGLFYLPRLFVYHAMADDAPGIERFQVMERKLLYVIMTPSAIIAIVLGLWLWLGYGIGGAWMYAKVALV